MAISPWILQLESRTLFSAGDPDLSFGTGGFVYTYIGTQDGGRASGVELQTDGKIVVAGKANMGLARGEDFTLARYNPNGTLDATFGPGGGDGDGIVTSDFHIGIGDNANDLAIQADGKIVCLGYDFTLVRYNTDGSLDLDFGTDHTGVAKANYAGSQGLTMLIQPDGKILIAGAVSSSPGFSQSQFALARFNSDGTLDTTFGDDNSGTITTLIHTNFDTAEFITGIALDADANIVAVGETQFTPAVTQWALARFTPSGQLINTATFHPGTGDLAQGVVVTPDGMLIVAGGISWDFGIARFDSDLKLDTSFGTNGITTHAFDGFDIIDDIMLESDGKIVAGGQAGILTTRQFATARFNPDGTPDETYGSGGYQSVTFAKGGQAYSAALDGDGRAVLAGFISGASGAGFGVARFDGGRFAFRGAPINATATVQAEDFDNGSEGTAYHDIDNLNLGLSNYRAGSGIDIAESNGRRWIDNTRAGEWIEYTISVPSDANYDLVVTGGNIAGAGGTFSVSIDGTDATGIVSMPTVTGALSSFVAKSGISLSTGSHVVQFNFVDEGAGANVGQFDSFRLLQAGTILGRVFNDPNSNGIQNATEAGIANWMIYLDTNNNSVLDAGESSTKTNATGDYIFSGLVDGTYFVRQVLSNGYRKTLPGTGVPGYEAKIVSGAPVLNQNFGATTNIYLAGKVFDDANNNGSMDSGEPALAGVVINIISNNATIATRTTDANGFWQVKGLAPGTGQAKVVLPSGFSSANPNGGVYSGSMSSGQQNANLNFGLIATASATLQIDLELSILKASIDSIVSDLL